MAGAAAGAAEERLTLTAPSLRILHFVAAGALKAETANGVLRTVHGLATSLAARHRVEVWSQTRRWPARGQRVEGVLNRFFPPPWPRGAMSGRLLRAALRGLHGFDLLHLHSCWHPEQAALALLARLRRVPFVLTPNGSLSPEALQIVRRRKQLYGRLVERRLLRAASAVHLVSEQEAGHLEGFGLPGLSTCLVPNGIDLARVPEASEPGFFDPLVGTAREALRVVFVGRLDIRHKGLDLLIAGLAEARRRTGPLAAVVVIAGPCWPDRPDDVQALAQKAGVADLVHVHPAVFGADKYAALADADVVALTSRMEGLPFVGLEALAARRPLICTEATGLAEVVRGAGAGIVCAADRVGVADAILRAHHARGRLRAMGRSGRAAVERCFTWASAAAKMERCYREIVARGPRRAEGRA